MRYNTCNYFYCLLSAYLLLLAPFQVQAQESTVVSDSLKEDSIPKKRLVYELFNQIFTLSEEIEEEISSPAVQNTDNKVQIFGWHPSWLADSYANYNYDVLTSISYFSCTMVLEDGHLFYEHNDWNTLSSEAITHLADEKNCNTLLTLRCDKEDAITSLLSSKEEIKYCVKYVSDLVTSRENVEGLTISFVNMPEGYQEEFSDFIEKLKKSLDVFDKALVVALPAAPNSKTIDIPSIEKYANQFVMMGYNYYYSGSKKAGPVAPLFSGNKWGELNIQNSVNEYIGAGIPKNKLIVALPYYGAVWQIDTTSAGRVKYRFVEHKRINQIWDELGDTKYERDSVSVSAFYEYTDNGKHYICYFDDAKSLKTKFKWIQNQGLAGIGIWALGYDEGSDQLWNMLSKNFETLKNPGLREVVNDSIPDTTLSFDPGSLKSETINLFRQHEVQIVIGITIIGFVGLGTLLAFTSNSIFSKLLIYDIKKYLKIAGIHTGFFLLLYLISGFVFHSQSTIDEHPDLFSGYLSSKDVQSPLTTIGLVGLAIITLLSWKAFLNVNKDVP